MKLVETVSGRNRLMRIRQENIPFGELLNCLNLENNENNVEKRKSESLQYATDYLIAVNNEPETSWTLVDLSRGNILTIMLPAHRHPRENPQPLIPEQWLAVSSAAGRVRERTQETGKCWDNINSHKNRDFSQTHIFLKWQNGLLINLDGLHRLLAYAIFDNEQVVPAYVALPSGANLEARLRDLQLPK